MNEKAQRIVELARQELGSPYVFGAVGENCTPALRGRRQRSDHPTIRSKCQVLTGAATACDGCAYEGRRMYDCRGLTWWLLQQVGISISSVGATTQWNTEASWARKGSIGKTAAPEDGRPGAIRLSLPDLPCCLFCKNGARMSHTGAHIGGGVIIDCSTGVTLKKWSAEWTHWAIPAGLYTAEEMDAAQEVTVVSVLKTGSKGDAVRNLQAALNMLGYACGEVDGVYGAKTAAAVAAFQSAHRLETDGKAGEATQNALAAMLKTEEQSAGEPKAQEETNPTPTAAEAEDGTIEISLDGLTVSLSRAQARELYNRLVARLEVRA